MDYDNLAASPITKAALENLSSDMEGPRIRLYRADEEDEDINGDEDENEDGDDDVGPRKKIDLGRHPMEYHVYEVWAGKNGDSLTYWVYSADYIVEDGDSTTTAHDEATRAEAIEYVEEALSYEHAIDVDEDRIELDWISKDADGNKTVDFPEDDEILGYWAENESIIIEEEMAEWR